MSVWAGSHSDDVVKVDMAIIQTTLNRISLRSVVEHPILMMNNDCIPQMLTLKFELRLES